jgi:protein MpaA
LKKRRSQFVVTACAVALGAAALSGSLASGEEPALPPMDVLLGKSVEGRSIYAYRIGSQTAKRKILVFGQIHGDERAGTAIANKLWQRSVKLDAQLWVVPELNPDGARARTRQNARGVDLNRNFPWRWRRAGQPFDQQYSGPKALSEPESRIAHHLIAKLQPEITIWFHQPLGLVDLSGGDPQIERRFARLAGLPVKRLARYRGSAASWQNDRIKGSTAFVAELRGGRFSGAAQEHYAESIRALIRQTN